VFALGRLVGMACVTASFAAPVAAAAHRWSGTHRLIRFSTGTLSVALCVWLAYRVGWHDGLFLAAPHWIPH
jgi:hypothetical protein